jgi:2,5-diamino-6-(ribosylamino)-4(3H)-pyrimidinone 5'-phosphate reductase
MSSRHPPSHKRPRPGPLAGKSGRTSLPFVFINVAMTADGKLAPANRHFVPFSSRRDQQHLLELRATADAVMNGARTVDLTPVTLGPGPAKYRRLRLARGLSEYNLRIIASRGGTVNPKARIFQERFSPIIVLTTGRASARRLRELRAVADVVKVCGKREIDFVQAFRWLGEEWKVKRLLCEGGGEINDALFGAGLVREVHVTICPKIFGGRAAPTLADGLGARSLSRATALTLKSARRVGQELFLIYSVAPRRRSSLTTLR